MHVIVSVWHCNMHVFHSIYIQTLQSQLMEWIFFGITKFHCTDFILGMWWIKPNISVQCVHLHYIGLFCAVYAAFVWNLPCSIHTLWIALHGIVLHAAQFKWNRQFCSILNWSAKLLSTNQIVWPNVRLFTLHLVQRNFFFTFNRFLCIHIPIVLWWSAIYPWYHAYIDRPVQPCYCISGIKCMHISTYKQ